MVKYTYKQFGAEKTRDVDSIDAAFGMAAGDLISGNAYPLSIEGAEFDLYERAAKELSLHVDAIERVKSVHEHAATPDPDPPPRYGRAATVRKAASTDGPTAEGPADGSFTPQKPRQAPVDGGKSKPSSRPPSPGGGTTGKSKPPPGK